MNKRKAYHVGLLILLLITWLTGAWFALHWQQQWSFNDQDALNLNAQQMQTLSTLPDNIVIEAFVSRHPRMRRSILEAIEPVKAVVPQLSVQWINPDTHPLAVQERGISREGQVYVRVGEQGKRLAVISPITLTEALLSFAQSSQMMIGFSQQNGERALLSDTPGAWMRFYQHFKQAGMTLAVLDTQTIATIPENIDLLIIADPQILSSRTEKLLTQYLQSGGDLIYTTDTQHPYLPPSLSNLLPLTLYDGTLVDANARKFGFDNPTFQVVELLADHDISRPLQQSPLLAGAVGLEIADNDQWQTQALLWSSDNSWLETDAVAQTINLDADELRGPIALAAIFSREINGKAQRIVVLGDSDLWSDAYFFTGGNRALAEQLFAYFKPQANATKIAREALSDQFITVDETWLMLLAIILLAMLPLGLILVGIFRWRKPCI